MNQTISIILGVLFAGVVGLLCLFLYILNQKSDDYWKEVRRKLDKKK